MARKKTPPYEYLVEDRGYQTPCWIWQRGMHRKGYGLKHVRTADRPNCWATKLAHVAYWEAEHGPVPPGLELDHLCRQRPCCRPDHLEPVTHTENLRRGLQARGGTLPGARRSHCKWGHPLTPENLLQTRTGERRCRACNRERCAGRRTGTATTRSFTHVEPTQWGESR